MDFQEYISDKHVPEELASQLLRLQGEDGECVHQLILLLSPSANALKGILQLAEEICVIRDCSLSTVFEGSEVQSILLNERMSRKEKQKFLRLQLEAVRFPTAGKIRQTLEGAQQAMLKSHGVRVHFPADLEGDRLEVKVFFSSPEELLRIASALNKVANDETLAQMFQSLRGDDGGNVE